ncbi:MAG TPA: J domain-containing protein [Solirubrobacteraceae bacterium]|nr:J domain-containing protein [Solirubrobacteraceae bacterium]
MAADPFAVLGVAPDTPLEDVAASYRELAKRWHPDRGGGAEAARRMAEINAAYDVLRSGAWQARRRGGRRPGGAAPARAPQPRVRRVAAGSWLAEPVRRALGPELLSALHRGEDVALVTPVAVWASPQALLAVTDRRLLWLLDDAVTGRVRSLDLAAIAGVSTRLSWPRRRTAVLRVERRNGRRPLTFSELRPETAEAIAARVGSRR